MMERHVILGLVLGATLGVACHSARPSPKPIPAEPDPASQESLSALSEHVVKSEDGYFTATVEGSAPPTVTSDKGIYSISTPIGSSVPAECYLFKSRKSQATLLKDILGDILSPARGGVEKIEYEEIDAGALEGRPYISAAVVYVTRSKTVGRLKSYAIGRLSGPLVCLHNQQGYAKTFRQHVAGIVRTLSIKEPIDALAPPRIRRIYTFTLDGKKVGYEEELEYNERSGERLQISLAARFIPEPGGGINALDSARRVESDRRGVIDFIRYEDQDNSGELASLVVVADKANDYLVNGSVRNKSVSGRFKTKRGLWDDVKLREQFVKSQSASTPTLAYEAYLYDAEPLSPTPIQIERVAPPPVGPPEWGKLIMKVPDGTVTMTVDENGLITDMRIPAGKRTLHIQKVWSSEEYPGPKRP